MGISNFTGNANNNGNNNNSNNNTISNMPPIPNIPMGTDPTCIDPKEFLIDYNSLFASAGTVLFRDEIIQQTLSVMIGKNKPNALLIGPAGVGKTKIVEDLAYRLATNDPLLPDKLKGYTIYELPLQNIVSGSSLVGQLEEKIKAVIHFVSDPKEKAILFIDEIHQLTTSSASNIYQKIAQILKPALARGTIKCIGATTTQEAKTLADDPAFNRRFTKLIVDELTPEQTIEILLHAKSDFFQHYANKVSIDDDTLKTVVTLADEYRQAGSHRPDNALTLLDRSIGDAIVNRKIQETHAKATNNQTLIQALNAIPIIPLTEKQIKTTAIKLATGNSKPNELDEDELKKSLSRIKGQDTILDKLIRTIKEYNCPYYHFDGTNGQKNKPETFLFVGPSGVGKTEVTKILAQYTTGIEPIILNMTEYNSAASINRIIGAPAGYVGSDSNAELPFDKLESNPYQIVLLDEFEKCHTSVQTLFMQAFDEGYITTSKGSIVDFSRCIIIATSNAGNQELKKSLGFTNETDTNDANTNITELSKFFDIALLNRFNHIFTFNSISEDVYREIIQETYKRDVARILSTHPRTQLLPEIPDDDLDAIVKETYEKNFGARPAGKAVKKYVLNQVL